MTRSASLAALLAALALVPSAAARPFTPAQIAGAYRGTWDNRTFDVQGTFSVTFAAAGRSLIVGPAEVGGTGFGCPAPPAFPASGWTLAKGRGVNHWDAAGFRLRQAGDFGSIDIRYVARTGALKGTGTAPPSCAPGVTFRIAGWLKRGRLNGTATIDVGDRNAATTFTADRT